jgi:hypothetical protein
LTDAATGVLAPWHPITRDFGLINASPQQVLAAFTAWQSGIGSSYTRRTIETSLADAFAALPPLSMERRRLLFVATAAGWTAFFAGGIQGSDPAPVMAHLAREMSVQAMRVCATPADAMYPAVIWEVYAPPALGGTPPLGIRRTIAAANDGGKWVFEQSGEPFAFERTEDYGARRVRERFRRDMLAAYLAEFGLHPFDEGFYVVDAAHPVVLVERERRWTTPPPEFTLAEVVAGKPWQRTSRG